MPIFAGLNTSGGEGGIRIRAETYIQQDAEQQTAVLAILVYVRQCERQVNGRWKSGHHPPIYVSWKDAIVEEGS
jgi:hypothetical protein